MEQNSVVSSQSVSISDSEFERFRDYFYSKTGIYFDQKKRYFVDKRLVERMFETGHDTFRSYFTFLRFQPSSDELQSLVNLMTVNETYFLREEYQFKCLINSALGEILETKKRDQPIRIWCIPCSTGEEAYSIALYLMEYWESLDQVDVELVASDINTEALTRCHDGIYGSRSVQYLPKHMLEKHFRTLPGGMFQVSSEIRSCISFCRVNLNENSNLRMFRGFDVIFCRNMLIYFDDSSRTNAAGALYDALNPGGFVFLGHSESMSRMSSMFRVRKFPEAIVYQKPK